MSAPFCADCKWFGPDTHFPVCNAPQNMVRRVNRVTGETWSERRWTSCDLHRSNGRVMSLFENTCGKGARWFRQSEGVDEPVQSHGKAVSPKGTADRTTIETHEVTQ